ncbi:phage holin family protein [Paenibacillus chungangensis]|uniref:Holin family protein n=1 Tax=Paenibacillus chungangensis TaxID=696535 RepID=A0ABW3HQG2_9BACL
MNIGQLLISAAVGASAKETAFGGAVAAIGTTTAAYLGGWDIALRLLVFCMVADYITGLLGALKLKKLNSEVMFWGGVRKGVVLQVIALCVLLDQFVGNESPVFRTIALYFYIGREGLSIIENLGVLNVWVPQAIKERLQQLNRSGNQHDRP